MSRQICLTRIRRENPAFNYGFFRPNPLAFQREAGKNAGHGSDFTGPGSAEQAEIARSVRDVIRRKHFSLFRMSRRRPPAKTSEKEYADQSEDTAEGNQRASSCVI